MAVTTRTKTQLKEKIAGVLGILPEGGSLSFNDGERIDEQMEFIFREALEADLITFDINGDEIELDVYRPFANIIAYSLINEFGIPAERAAEIEKAAIKSEAILLKRTQQPYKPGRVRPEFF